MLSRPSPLATPRSPLRADACSADDGSELPRLVLRCQIPPTSKTPSSSACREGRHCRLGGGAETQDIFIWAWSLQSTVFHVRAIVHTSDFLGRTRCSVADPVCFQLAGAVSTYVQHGTGQYSARISFCLTSSDHFSSRSDLRVSSRMKGPGYI